MTDSHHLEFQQRSDVHPSGLAPLPVAHGATGEMLVQLLAALAAALHHDLDTAELGVGRAKLAFLDAGINSLAASNLVPVVIRGGLAPWQIRLAKQQIEEELATNIRVSALAERVRLSSSHFCRAFKESIGISPHAYVIRRRIERAKAMMLETSDSLCQISFACGFSDQAHLSRLFLRRVGQSPNVWRRTRQFDR